MKNNYPEIAQVLINKGAKIYVNTDNSVIKWRTTDTLLNIPENFLSIIQSGLYVESIY
ncbi:MAG: hypothetical protein AB8U25_04465 [Rickettsiales endosymbiont of Dermacentor nuttalli]